MNMHEKILDNLQELVYIADMETYELFYYNRALAEEFHIPQRLHGKCYEILQGRRYPCPFCTNGKLFQDGCYVWKFYNQLVGRHFLLSDSICEFNGRQVRTEIASDITEHVLLQEQLDKNLSLQNFINHCARKLYRQDADLPFLIDDVLAAIGEYLQADRAYIFEFSDDVVRNTLTLGFTASVGCAWVRREDDIGEGLIAADARMFAAKRDFYRSSPQSGRYRSGLDDVLDLARPGRLEELLASDSFTLYCQPQFRVADGAVVGGEILLRLISEGKVIPPTQFIPLLESLYAMPQVDLHVFGKVCACLKRWRDEGRPLVPMAVNFSRTTLAFPEVADRLEEIRQKFDIPAELLQVEITETASTEDYRTFQKVVDSIRAKGFRVAIDDFGVAYANLMILARLGFDELKLDKSLMDDLCGSDKRQRLLRLVIEAAEDMGIRTVAEGVETEEQLAVLRKLGCPRAQSYLLSRPLPVEQFAALLS